MKVICPYCHKELTGEDVPSISEINTGTSKYKYVCHKKICTNIEEHPDHNKIAVVYNPEEK